MLELATSTSNVFDCGTLFAMGFALVVAVVSVVRMARQKRPVLGVGLIGAAIPVLATVTLTDLVLDLTSADPSVIVSATICALKALGVALFAAGIALVGRGATPKAEDSPRPEP